VTKPVELKRPPSESLVCTLERLLARAKEGEIVGAVFLLAHGNSTSCYSRGYQPIAQFLLAFEDWKFQVMFDRNIDEIREKNDG
jgi:hypothetical protein